MKFSYVIFLMLVAFAFCPIGKAFAAGYAVAYAIDADGKTASGKLEACKYGEACEIVFDELKLIARIVFMSRRELSVSMRSRWLGCCFFGNGDDSIKLDPQQSVHRLQIYEGRGRRRNEVVINQKLGVLYLTFSKAH